VLITVVYFIQDASGHIKIGYAGHVRSQLRSLQVSNAGPLTLLRAIPGDKTLESSLHERFAPYSLGREWFKPHEELLAYIESLPDCEIENDGSETRSLKLSIMMTSEEIDRVQRLASARGIGMSSLVRALLREADNGPTTKRTRKSEETKDDDRAE
jgi:Meiotically Up-regulated Gene 113 (MUG113) protein